MNRRTNDHSPHDRVENDPVWELLAQSPPPMASPMFSRNVVRAARLATPSGWRGWFARNPAKVLGGFAAAAAAAAIAIGVLAWPQGDTGNPIGGNDPLPAPPAELAFEPFGELEELAQEELLLAAAADDLSKFSDDELIALLGF